MNWLVRVFYALLPIPLNRHFWRLVRRGQRALYVQFPTLIYLYFLRRAKTLGRTAPPPNGMLSFATLLAKFQLDTGWSATALNDDKASVSIHGVKRTIDFDYPFDRTCLDGTGYLWRMSIGYLSCFWGGEEAPSSNTIDKFERLGAAFTNRGAWLESGAFDTFWHPYCASHRLINLVAAALFADARGMTKCSLSLNHSISVHTAFVRANTEYDIHYNHLTKNLMSLMISESYRTGSINGDLFYQFMVAVDYQVCSDGGHAELCPMYHSLFLADLIVLQLVLSEDAPIVWTSWLQQKIEVMRSAAETMCFLGKNLSLFSDSWEDEAPAPFALGISISKDYLRVLPSTGYAKLYGGRFEIIMDCGEPGAPDNPGHGHDDTLAVEVAIDGARLIVDYGVESYEGGNRRHRTRSLSLHNSPQAFGIRGMDTWSSFRVGNRSGFPEVTIQPDLFGWRGVVGTFRPIEPKHVQTRRQIALHKTHGVLIVDQWLGLEDGDMPSSTFLLPWPTGRSSEPSYVFDLDFEEVNVLAGSYGNNWAWHHDVYGCSKNALALTLSPYETVDKLKLVALHIGPKSGLPAAREYFGKVRLGLVA
jgi:hypothetical protein